MTIKRKIFLQVALTIILSIFVAYIYNNYYKRNNLLYLEPKSENKINQDTSLEENIIENIRYVFNNSNGDILKISANSGVPQNEAPHILFLTNVVGELYLNNKEKINLTSNFAYFDTKSSETNLIENVKISRDNEYISSDELHLVLSLNEEIKKKNNYKENYITINKNITIHRPNQILRADVIEINLISKNYKIFMKNENDKVAIETNLN